MRSAIAALLLTAAPAFEARGEEVIIGPVAAELVRVIDGDTIAVVARVWPGVAVSIHVRLAAVDAPELRRPRCPAEAAAEAARDRLAALVGRTLTLRDITLDKYGGRVVARVSADGEDVAASLLADGLAAPYGAPLPWCSQF